PPHRFHPVHDPIHHGYSTLSSSYRTSPGPPARGQRWGPPPRRRWAPVGWSTLGAIRRPLLAHPGRLTLGELGHAAVVGVVHEVVDRVHAFLAASVPALGALVRGLRLRRGVVDLVAAGAAVLEGVVEPEPVPDLVGAGVALVVVLGSLAGQRLVQHDDAVVTRGVLVPLGEGGPAEQAAADAGGVEVQVALVALAQRRLHLLLLGGVGLDGVPARVVDAVD